MTLVDFAMQHMDIQYDYKNKEGFDCSGFVQHCYKRIGITVPRSSKTQAVGGEAVELQDIQVGDVLVFTGSDESFGQVTSGSSFSVRECKS